MSLVEEKVLVNEFRNYEDGEEQPMILAKGLGVSVGSGGGSRVHDGDFTRETLGVMAGVVMAMMLKNTIDGWWRNYAQFLYQESEQDLEGAEEIYSRAILVDPRDGEILSQYARLVWELHHDHDRASSYIERAVQAVSDDSHVHAAYANFLWRQKTIRMKMMHQMTLIRCHPFVKKDL
ncbi:hypothetical protein RJ641_030145 [Dillenia turbinata]|uniref:Uncharacterized protein n=1 Tax=Dillenia turbinata TaxID=194707 RepID=A0AAN8VUW0_9MAGN